MSDAGPASCLGVIFGRDLGRTKKLCRQAEDHEPYP